MGTYHTFFVADDRQLDALFPGWKPAKPEPTRVETVNPFTKQKLKQVVYQWEPVARPSRLGTPNLYDDAWEPAQEPVLRPTGQGADYARRIEEAGPPGLLALPHFRAKNVTPLCDFDGVVRALFGRAKGVPPARIGDDEDDDVARVFRLPREAARELLSLDEARLRSVVERLFDDSALAEDDGTGDDALLAFMSHVMAPLLALCKEAEARGAEVCHYYALHY